MKSNENTALSLYQLIGAPLHALIDAEAQAAISTRNFIESIGFQRAETQGGEDDDFGELRMARFSQTRSTSAGKPEVVEINVPVLSMLPIPALQIKNAELDFFIKIVESSQSKTSPENEPEARQNERDGEQLPELFDFKASLGRDPNHSKSQRGIESQIKMKITVEQADLPGGLANLLSRINEGVSATPISSTTSD